MGHAFATLDELGDNYGFRKVRGPLGVTAFGVNVLVYPAGAEGVHHYHDEQDELYSSTAGRRGSRSATRFASLARAVSATWSRRPSAR